MGSSASEIPCTRDIKAGIFALRFPTGVQGVQSKITKHERRQTLHLKTIDNKQQMISMKHYSKRKVRQWKMIHVYYQIFHKTKYSITTKV